MQDVVDISGIGIELLPRFRGHRKMVHCLSHIESGHQLIPDDGLRPTHGQSSQNRALQWTKRSHTTSKQSPLAVRFMVSEPTEMNYGFDEKSQSWSLRRVRKIIT